MSALLSAQNTDILNTAALTGETVSVPVNTLAVEADGSVTDVTKYTSCRSTEEDVLKVSLWIEIHTEHMFMLLVNACICFLSILCLLASC